MLTKIQQHHEKCNISSNLHWSRPQRIWAFSLLRFGLPHPPMALTQFLRLLLSRCPSKNLFAAWTSSQLMSPSNNSWKKMIANHSHIAGVPEASKTPNFRRRCQRHRKSFGNPYQFWICVAVSVVAFCWICQSRGFSPRCSEKQLSEPCQCVRCKSHLLCARCRRDFFFAQLRTTPRFPNSVALQTRVLGLWRMSSETAGQRKIHMTWHGFTTWSDRPNERNPRVWICAQQRRSPNMPRNTWNLNLLRRLQTCSQLDVLALKVCAGWSCAFNTWSARRRYNFVWQNASLFNTHIRGIAVTAQDQHFRDRRPTNNFMNRTLGRRRCNPLHLVLTTSAAWTDDWQQC